MSDEVTPPSRALLALEARGLLELPAVLAAWPLLLGAPRGTRHSVLVLPGFGADDGSTRVIRSFLDQLGYEVHGWDRGRNDRPPGSDLPDLQARVEALSRSSGLPVSLVGWSRGGIMARELARGAPDRVRLVVTLGSPFAAPQANNVGLIMRPSRRRPEFSPPSHPRTLLSPRPVPVPATSIYTRSDGVVAWRACLDEASETAENVEVRTSHLGLGFHAPALWVIADRLAQPIGQWRPFRPPPLLRGLYPSLA